MTAGFEKTVSAIIEDWLKRAQEMYQLPSKRSEDMKVGPGERHCHNPFLTYEADIKAKLGAYLELKLMEHGTNWRVHSETEELYQNGRTKPDLTIHEITTTCWPHKDDIINSCRAVIEIKYANRGNPREVFTKANNAMTDLDKLYEFGRSRGEQGQTVFLAFLLIDEGCLIPPDVDIGNLKSKARDLSIKIFSNRADLSQ